MDVLQHIYQWVWGIPTLVMILLVGLYLSFRTGCCQLRLLPKALRMFFSRLSSGEKPGEGVSSFRALCTALAATVGTGNLAGVAGAIAIGGPGAVFWMWLCGLLGIISVSLEGGASSYAYHYVNVTCRAAVLAVVTRAANNKSLAVINTCGDIHSKLFCFSFKTSGTALLARILYKLTCSATLVTSSCGLELHTAKVLHYPSLTRSATGRTGFSATACRARTVTGGALFKALEGYFFLASKHRFLKRDGDIHFNVIALLRPVSLCSAAAKATAEKASENISKVNVKAAKAAAVTTGTCRGIKRRVTVLVIFCSL